MQCSIVYIESYLSSAYILSQADSSLNFRVLSKSSFPCALLLTICYSLLRTTPFLREWCEGDNWFRPVRVSDGYKLEPAGVEEHHCAMACVIIVSGAVAL